MSSQVHVYTLWFIRRHYLKD